MKDTNNEQYQDLTAILNSSDTESKKPLLIAI
ncbi:hypothetical protein CLU96_3737 [Chryseobacterium sp. 52]|nr:hypothetical protein CLU96_3737 [Chryseobacterium sp. 52]